MCTFRLLPILLLVFSLFASPPLQAQTPSEGEDSEQPTGEEAAPPGDEEELDPLLLEATTIGRRVAEIRGLPLLEPIPKGIKSRDQLRAMLLERFEEEVSEDQFQAEEMIYKRLGLFPEDLDYRQLMLDLLTEQIAGFYDQNAKELYIMEGLPEAIQGPTMAHEIFHAIQDQHFDIGAMLSPFTSQEHGDFALARMALIEGDAFVLMFDYQLWEIGQLPMGNRRSVADIPALAALILEIDPEAMSAVEQLAPATAPSLGTSEVPSLTDSVLGNAPPIVRDVLLFPYMGGMRFVLQARAGRSWQEFNLFYSNAPLSTSQILHPQRYFDGDVPLHIDFDAGPAIPEYRRAYDSVLGELQTRSWLSTHVDELELSLQSTSEEIAAGWDGDRLQGYLSPDGEQMIAVHLSSWRSPEEARAFAHALEEIARRRHDLSSSHTTGEHGESWCLRIADETSDLAGQRILVERWGELVLYIEGAPSTLNAEGREVDPSTYLIRDAVWNSMERVPFDQTLEAREQRVLVSPDLQ